MKVALFSDIHGNLTGLRAVLAAIERLGGADLWYAAGDILAGGPGAEDLLDVLIDRKVRLLRGNAEESILDVEASLRHLPDRWHAYSREITAWLRGRLSQPYLDHIAYWPLSETVEFAAGRRLLVCHATPASPWERVCSPRAPIVDLRAAYGHLDADVVAYGHWHGPHVLQVDGKLLLNVSSVGFRTDATSAFTLLEWADERWIVQQHLVPYDAEAEERLMTERRVPLP